MVENMPTDMQYKDGLRKDKFLNDLIIEALENDNKEKALEYLRKDNERIEKALEE
jgi:predicted P-loop ATPase